MTYLRMTEKRKSDRKSGAEKGSTKENRSLYRNRVMPIAVCLLFLALVAAGCGKTEKPIPVDLSAGNIKGLQDEDVESDRTDGENDSPAAQGDTKSDSGSSAGAGNGDVAGKEAKPDADENTGGGAADQADISAENDAAKETEQDSSQSNSEQYAQSGTKLEGDVRSVGADSFVICKNETWEEDGYSYGIAAPAPGYEDESDLLTIHTTKDCDYQYKTVKNGGMNPEDVSTRDGSFADVKEGLAVTITGSWQDDGSFLADSVVLMEIV